jgi:hypothetical protein
MTPELSLGLLSMSHLRWMTCPGCSYARPVSSRNPPTKASRRNRRALKIYFVNYITPSEQNTELAHEEERYSYLKGNDFVHQLGRGLIDVEEECLIKKWRIRAFLDPALPHLAEEFDLANRIETVNGLLRQA